MKVDSFGNAQHIGSRKKQEDSFGFSPPDDAALVAHGGVVAALSDGMGGMERGGEAGAAAVKAFLEAYGRKRPDEPVPGALARSLGEANRAVCRVGAKAGAPGGVGATLAAAAVRGDELHWVSVGDSRVYLLRDGSLAPLTEDHVYARELDAACAAGRISRAEALGDKDRETLTSHLGLDPLPEVDSSRRPLVLLPGDRVLVCSDGLYRALSDEEMARALSGAAPEACDRLVREAVRKGIANQDNVTAMVMGGGGAAEARGAGRGAARRLAAAAAALCLLLTGLLVGWWLGKRSAPEGAGKASGGPAAPVIAPARKPSQPAVAPGGAGEPAAPAAVEPATGVGGGHRDRSRAGGNAVKPPATGGGTGGVQAPKHAAPKPTAPPAAETPPAVGTQPTTPQTPAAPDRSKASDKPGLKDAQPPAPSQDTAKPATPPPAPATPGEETPAPAPTPPADKPPGKTAVEGVRP